MAIKKRKKSKKTQSIFSRECRDCTRKGLYLKNKQGFSLIELLISFSIIMFLILEMAQLTLYSFRVKRRSDYSLKSAELASSKLEYFKSLPFESPELNESFKTESLQGDATLEIYHREWGVQNVSLNMKRIEIECFCENCPQKKTQLVLILSKELGF